MSSKNPVSAEQLVELIREHGVRWVAERVGNPVVPALKDGLFLHRWWAQRTSGIILFFPTDPPAVSAGASGIIRQPHTTPATYRAGERPLSESTTIASGTRVMCVAAPEAERPRYQAEIDALGQEGDAEPVILLMLGDGDGSR